MLYDRLGKFKKNIFFTFMQKKLLTIIKKIVYIALSHVHRYCGRLAEWLCRGLQIRLYRFDSGTGLHEILFRLSSAVEQSAVNRLVVGSNPTAGANGSKCQNFALLRKGNTRHSLVSLFDFLIYCVLFWKRNTLKNCSPK